MELGVKEGFTEVTAQLSRGLSGEEKGRVSIPTAKVFSRVGEDLGGRVDSGCPERQISQSTERHVYSVKFISL